MNRNQRCRCVYFPCKCFTLGSGISSFVFNGLYNPTSNFRVGSIGAVSANIPDPQNTFCAAKQINRDHAATKYAQIEIDILKSLEHPNIVALLDILNLPDGKKTLFMERCDGNLDALIKQPEHYWGLPPSLVLSVVSQYTDGFRYLYEHNVVHRDIKPLNILYNINISHDKGNGSELYGRRDEYIFKLADFGVAKKTTSEGTDILKSLVGTPEFLCPEVLRGKYGSTADLWSAAVMFYFSIAGHLPFVGRDFHSKFTHYLILLASSRKYDNIAAYCGSSDMSQIEFSSYLPQYCQLFGRLKTVFEKLLRLMLSPALNKSLEVDFTKTVHDSIVAGARTDQNNSKEMFEKFFRYVTAITQHCWFHVFDVSTFTISVAHVNPDSFSETSEGFATTIVHAAEKSLGEGRSLIQIGNSVSADSFNGYLVFEGGMTAFRSRYMSGTLTNWRKTLLVCVSNSTVARNEEENPLKYQLDALSNELFVKREFDFSRLPKTTEQFCERTIFLTQSGLLPAISSYRATVIAHLDTASQLVRNSNLPDMLAEPYQNELSSLSVDFSKTTDDSDRKSLEAFSTISKCYHLARALSHQCDVYAAISAPQDSRCNNKTSATHRDIQQLIVSATSTGRSDINRRRVKLIGEFVEATNLLFTEFKKSTNLLTKIVVSIEQVKQRLHELCQSDYNASDIEPLAQNSFGSSDVDASAQCLDFKTALTSLSLEPKVKQGMAELMDNLDSLHKSILTKK